MVDYILQVSFKNGRKQCKSIMEIKILLKHKKIILSEFKLCSKFIYRQINLKISLYCDCRIWMVF